MLGRRGRPPPARRRRLLDAALAVALAGIVVAAVVNLIAEGPGSENASAPATTAETGRTERGEPPRSLPSLLPLPGALREEGGRLWWTGDDCRAAFLDLASAAVVRIPGKLCRIWPSPDGTRLVGLRESRSDALAGRGLELVVLGGDRRVVGHRPGLLAAEVTWSSDGSSFAACFGTRDGVVTQVFTPARGRVDVEGACAPSFLADGPLAVAAGDPAAVVVDDTSLLDAGRIERIVGEVPPGSRLAVSALASGGDRLAVGLVGLGEPDPLPNASALAVLDAEGDVVFEARLFPQTSLPAAVGLAPDGSALWYRDIGNDRTVVLSLPGARRLSFFAARWFAWSPEGRYLAAARRDAIALLAWPQMARRASIPVDATQIAWTRSPSR